MNQSKEMMLGVFVFRHFEGKKFHQCYLRKLSRFANDEGITDVNSFDPTSRS